MSLAAPERRELLRLARKSIDASVAAGASAGPAPFPALSLRPDLTVRRSSFVTLRHGEELRGCCGTLDAPRPLAEDVWRNAWAAAFSDHRFPTLTAAEWPQLSLHLSLLTPPERLDVTTESQLLAMLRPSVDGLILEAETGRATFLPAVWEQLPDPAQFVRQLKMKAGWPAGYWSDRVRVSRYTTESFGEESLEA
ncbi:MAG TPA: AmmeMemoRadiSam system protein A [Steroidobacteraceae bacterium]|jgi:AmmeMemoRadiSam system protein A|nr:AmmeMemoRadiSam system protein A [Steroidobacteraceae bacterium]